jgi:hypothetical protein
LDSFVIKFYIQEPPNPSYNFFWGLIISYQILIKSIIYFGSLSPHLLPFYGLNVAPSYSFNSNSGLKHVGMFCVPCFDNRKKAMESPNQSNGWCKNLQWHLLKNSISN